jgi:hypothetical protein
MSCRHAHQTCAQDRIAYEEDADEGGDEGSVDGKADGVEGGVLGLVVEIMSCGMSILQWRMRASS